MVRYYLGEAFRVLGRARSNAIKIAYQDGKAEFIQQVLCATQENERPGSRRVEVR